MLPCDSKKQGHSVLDVVWGSERKNCAVGREECYTLVAWNRHSPGPSERMDHLDSRGLSTLVSQQTGEHDILIKTAHVFGTALEQGNIPQLVKHAGRLWDFLVSEMIDHFELEERVFFPSFSLSVHSPDTARLVLRLQKEHGYFEKDAEVLKQLLAKKPLDQALENRIFAETFRCLVQRLTHHALCEVKELFPLIETNRRCMYYVKKLASE